VQPLLDWLEAHQGLVRAAGAASIATFVGSLIALPVLVASLPSDYFAAREAPPTRWRERRPVVRLAVLVLKNAVGAVLVVMGLAMFVLPGQGVLTLVAGVVLLNFPGKRRLEIRIARLPSVFRGLNWLRRRAGRSPLEAPYGGHP
jgi:archaellum biogenesis protein FlaJ (TadC family)